MTCVISVIPTAESGPLIDIARNVQGVSASYLAKPMVERCISFERQGSRVAIAYGQAAIAFDVGIVESLVVEPVDCNGVECLGITLSFFQSESSISYYLILAPMDCLSWMRWATSQISSAIGVSSSDLTQGATN